MQMAVWGWLAASSKMRPILATLVAIRSALAWDVAGTPPLGWNAWNSFGCEVNSSILMDTAQAMHDSGLQTAGYRYVNSDGVCCFRLPQGC